MRRPIAIWTKLWIIGGVLVLLGTGIPFLIVMKVLPSNLLLLGFAIIASMVGVFMGYYAMSIYVRVHRRGPPRP
jgi:hypothetical protein